MKRVFATARFFAMTAMLWASPWVSHAQNTPASASSTTDMDMSNMPGMSDSTITAPDTHRDAMQAMDMADNAAIGMLLVDQLEAFYGHGDHGQAWQAQGWYGYDENKFWVRTEGDRSEGRLQSSDLEALWNHAVTAFWSTQLGLRGDIGPGPSRLWTAFGIQGMAPYNLDVEATGYVGANGRTAARFRSEYELRFTQHLILQPELELNLYSTDAIAQRLGNELSNVALGMRLRYEFRRQFAPYLGVNWVRRLSAANSTLSSYRQPLVDRQIVAGIRFWF
jgi:copper resistance protein B